MNLEVLAETLRSDYPEVRIVASTRFSFQPPRTVHYEADGDAMSLLHEMGHALSRHRDFKTGVERLKMEREAWERARELAKRYGVQYDEEMAERALDSYRDWLHQKSRCPRCGLTRFQTPDGVFHCPRCENFT